LDWRRSVWRICRKRGERNSTSQGVAKKGGGRTTSEKGGGLILTSFYEDLFNLAQGIFSVESEMPARKK